ncbi:SDR family NAD(P)-dependent oxidoreductase [Xanthobacter sp. KR7-225]|uniref:SDR family NAD(P)-dependent oxidoreductase n=1 Tax=Xanthobacter sp. KR7-225 TaxID=3156613 RepID=UPI0032B354AF
MLSLKNKVAIVSGAGCVAPGWGNGRATAVLLARQGAKVFAIDKSREAAEETARIIAEEGGEVLVHACDVTSSAQILEAVETCARAFGQIDILVNIVGGSQPGGAESMPEEVWDNQISMNLTSVFLACKFALPHLRQRPLSAIVNLSSIAAIRIMRARPHVAYSAAKYGVIAMSRSIAIENAKDGVRCNTVIPGLMHTPVVAHRLVPQLGAESAETLIATRDAQVPMGKAGDAWDIAHAVLFLVSDEARHITGTELIVDGGLSAATG